MLKLLSTPPSSLSFLHLSPLKPQSLRNYIIMEPPPSSSSSSTFSRPTIMTYNPAPTNPSPPQAALSRYESQKRRDWTTFRQYLKNHRPPLALSQGTYHHVLDFLRYLDQFGKTKIHAPGCMFYGQPDPPGPCPCPLRQAWGSLDALIGRLRAAYEEHSGSPETNPFAASAIRVYLREVREHQAKARGIPCKKTKKKKKKPPVSGGGAFSHEDQCSSSPSSSSTPNSMIIRFS